MVGGSSPPGRGKKGSYKPETPPGTGIPLHKDTLKIILRNLNQGKSAIGCSNTLLFALWDNIQQLQIEGQFLTRQGMVAVQLNALV